MDIRFFLLGCTISLLVPCYNADGVSDEKDVSKFLVNVNDRLAELWDELTLAKWNNEVSLPEDMDKIRNAEEKIKDYIQSISAQVVEFRKLSLKNADLKKQLFLIPLGYEALPKKDLELFTNISNTMSDFYAAESMCMYKEQSRCNITFIDTQLITFGSEDVEEIKHYWLEWRRATAELLGDFVKYVELYRKAAELNGFSKPSDFWFRDFRESSSSILKPLETIFMQHKPLYQQLHAHIRGQLRSKYGSELIRHNEALPHDLYGIFLDGTRLAGDTEFVPYKETHKSNITGKLLEIEMTPKNIFDHANDFLTSMGMPKLEETFWKEHCERMAVEDDMYKDSAVWNFFRSHQVKLSYSPYANELQFFNMFSRVSEVHYHRANDNLVTLYRKQPIPDVRLSYGKFFALAASSPKYLESVGLVGPNFSTEKSRINRMYIKGIQTIPLVRALYIGELLRLYIIDKTMAIDDNCALWSFLEDIHGVRPPAVRSKANPDVISIMLPLNYDFSTTDEVYSQILEFQLFEHFCALTGEYVKGNPDKPLDMCDLRGHPEVGEQIYKVMSLGSSINFKEMLKLLINKEELSLDGLLEYFRPLQEWLTEANKEKNYEVGWGKSGTCQP